MGTKEQERQIFLVACSTKPRKKMCRSCGIWLRLEHFHRRNYGSLDGRKSHCKRCTKEREKRREPKSVDRKKHRVRQRTRYAVQVGKLVKKPCQHCGSSVGIEAHHNEYESVHAHLNVTWLCSVCHHTEHSCRVAPGQQSLFTFG